MYTNNKSSVQELKGSNLSILKCPQDFYLQCTGWIITTTQISPLLRQLSLWTYIKSVKKWFYSINYCHYVLSKIKFFFWQEGILLFHLQLDFMPLLGILIFSDFLFQKKYSWHNINEEKEMSSSCQISSVHEDILCD